MVLLPVLAAAPAVAQDRKRPNAVTVFAAQMADNNWHEIVALDDVSMRDAYLVGAGVSRELAGSDSWALEAEGQVVRHFGGQEHWEFNGVLVGRWRGAPWRETLPTSLAFGIGPSYASAVPAEEVARDGESARFLLYWMAEAEIGVPDSRWSAVARLHHRSNAYGVLAEDGGSNWLTIGIRRRF